MKNKKNTGISSVENPTRYRIAYLNIYFSPRSELCPKTFKAIPYNRELSTLELRLFLYDIFRLVFSLLSQSKGKLVNEGRVTNVAASY